MSGRAPIRWVTHRLNGAFVVGGSYLGSRYVPLPLSWPIAHAGAWLVGHCMSSVRDALVDNLRAVFPHESDAQLRRRAYRTCHTYTDDWMDFMRSRLKRYTIARMTLRAVSRTGRILLFSAP